MMEEVIPSASNVSNNTTTNRSSRRPVNSNQHQYQSRTGSSSIEGNPANDNNHDGHSSPRINIGDNNSSIINNNFLTIVNAPTILLSKIILIITIILRFLLHPLRRFANIAFPAGELDGIHETSDKAARVFIRFFNKMYIEPLVARQLNNQHNNNNNNPDDNVDLALLECPFVQSGYTNTLHQIYTKTIRHTEQPDVHPPPPLMLVYLHSPLHADVPQFLADTFVQPRIISLLNQHASMGSLVPWAGSVYSADGSNVQTLLNVSCYPFLAIFRVVPAPLPSTASASSTSSSSSRTTNANSPSPSPPRATLELHFRVEGMPLLSLTHNQLFTHLSNTLNRYQTVLTEQTFTRLQRQEEVRLRQEQDREYREALLQDQRRERERMEEQRKAEETKKREEEEKRLVEERKNNKLAYARRLLRESITGGSISTSSEHEDLDIGVEPTFVDERNECARVRLMLPSGLRIERKFRGVDTIDVVRAFLTLYFDKNDIKIENFELSCNYPKKTLVNVSATLKEEGLCPQAVIMVQDLDA